MRLCFSITWGACKTPDAQAAPQTSQNPGIQVVPLSTSELRTSGVKSSTHMRGIGKTVSSSGNPLTKALSTLGTGLDAGAGKGSRHRALALKELQCLEKTDIR